AVHAREGVTQLVIHHREEQIPLALHRAYLAQQAGILYRDRGLTGQQDRDRLVLVAELGGVDLLGEVQIAEHGAASLYGDAEKRFHRRVVLGESVALRVTIDVGTADRLAFPNDQAEQPVPPGQVADLQARRLIEPRSDALRDARPIGAEDAERGVAGPYDRPCRVYDFLQHRIEIVMGKDRSTGRQQPFEPFPDARPFLV